MVEMSRLELTKDTQLCISLAGRPSNIGTRFHNFLYRELGLDFIYKAFSTQDIEGAIAGVRALGIRGCSVSMPFKQAVLPLVDHVNSSAADIDAANTIVNDNGVLTASNTDVEAVQNLVHAHHFDRYDRAVIRGSGGMARAVVAALRAVGIDHITVWARNELQGRAVADLCGGTWTATEPEIEGDVIVNVTPVGMTGPDESTLSFSAPKVADSVAVIDVVAFPHETPLISLARQLGKPIVSGDQIISGQAALQFQRYTGVTPPADLVLRASEFSRATQ